jgi:hypothetical protein
VWFVEEGGTRFDLGNSFNQKSQKRSPARWIGKENDFYNR